jgi:hypothetical protein
MKRCFIRATLHHAFHGGDITVRLDFGDCAAHALLRSTDDIRTRAHERVPLPSLSSAPPSAGDEKQRGAVRGNLEKSRTDSGPGGLVTLSGVSVKNYSEFFALFASLGRLLLLYVCGRFTIEPRDDVLPFLFFWFDDFIKPPLRSELVAAAADGPSEASTCSNKSRRSTLFCRRRSAFSRRRCDPPGGLQNGKGRPPTATRSRFAGVRVQSRSLSLGIAPRACGFVDLVGAQLGRASLSTEDRGRDDVGRCAAERRLNCDVRTITLLRTPTQQQQQRQRRVDVRRGERRETRQRLADRVV